MEEVSSAIMIHIRKVIIISTIEAGISAIEAGVETTLPEVIYETKSICMFGKVKI